MKKLLAFFTSALASASLLAATLAPVQLLNPTGSAAGQAIVSTGASSAPAWGSVSATSLAAIAANSVLANVTASSASPAAFAMPSCSASTSALGWTSGTGFTCNSSINAATLGGATFASPGSIGSTTAGSGAFTTLSASSTVSGTGITNLFASPPSIGATTPAAGAFTTLSATGLITPSSTIGIKGTSTNDSAQAGSIGETISSIVLQPSSVALTSGTPANVTSINLTAGSWLVWGQVNTSPAGTTVQSSTIAGISQTSATFVSVNLGSTTLLPFTASAGSAIEAPIVPYILKLSGSTTLYLIAQSTFTTSTNAAYGFIAAFRFR